jgi:hypothetical protein
MRRLLQLAAVTLSAAATGGSPPLQGLWIQHDEWQYAPKEVNEDGDVHKFASAVVMNFCPNGVFHMATGIIYQSTKSPTVQIGASDGLAIYLGTWRETPPGIAVQYRLVDAEFADLLSDSIASASHAAQPTWVNGRLVFPFTNVVGKVFALRLTPAARYEKRVVDEWVRCEPRRPDPPVPPTPRTGGDRGRGAP